LDAQTFSRAMGQSLPLAQYEAILPRFVQSMIRAECTTIERAAMYFAQVGHESSGLYYREEIASGAAYEGRRDLGNTQPGDGVRYKGRGPIQITGRHNYGELSRWAFGKGIVDSPTKFVDNPTMLGELEWGLLGAEWYWTVARPDINALSDRGDLDTVTRRINGGTNGINDRRERYRNAINLGNAILPRPAVPPRRVLPLDKGAIVTDTFGWQDWRKAVHWGVDYGKEGGSGGLPVFAMQGGTVVAAGPADGFGRWVLIDHPAADGGGLTVYGHVIPEVRVGQRVEAAQRIATINPDKATNGGVSPHVHVEVHRYVWVKPGPDRLDPLVWLANATWPSDPAPSSDDDPEGWGRVMIELTGKA
jgi:predicted chitinase